MTINQVLAKYSNVEIDILLAFALKKTREFLYLHPEYKLTRIQEYKLSSIIKCRQKGEPIAYVLGYKDFMGLRFKVDHDVLIPRPETEVIVEKAIERLKDLRFKDSGHVIRILDIGTGSGCIIISLAELLRTKNLALSTKYYGSDVSLKALKVARQNAKTILGSRFDTSKYRSGARIKFIKSDLLGNIKEDFDVIVANLPYVWKGWKDGVSAETEGLKFEPANALFAKESGLVLIRKLLEQIAEKKNKPKLVFLEFDPRQKNILDKLIKKILPQAKRKFYRDYHNRWRVAEISIL